ncbi:DUF1232 domain-containing protein [Streptomyces sp. Inha503]|uniref:DUF1232 domain-containing protein n=1 Tax=Streptomyces sp. Inha503 TaxID=3383314 RepID=UPI0039A1D002
MSVSTADAPSATRVRVWRKLRSLGALHLQQSVCLLPDRDGVRRQVTRLLASVRADGGTARRLTVDIADDAGLLAAWLALLIMLALIRPKGTLLTEAIRLLPDLVRLLRRLAADRTLPRSVRVRLGLLMVYLALPIDLIPDFLPVIGYADDAIIVAFVLRSVVRRAGIEAVRVHWPGTEDGFAALSRLAGLRKAEPRK